MNAHRAVILPNKIYGYLLQSDHKQGAPKAKMMSLLGYECRQKAEISDQDRKFIGSGRHLVDQLRQGIEGNDATFSGRTPAGIKFRVDLPVVGPNLSRRVFTSIWVFAYRTDGTISNRPNFVTMYPKKSDEDGLNKVKSQ